MSAAIAALVEHAAAGALVAQKLIHDVREGRAGPDDAHRRLCELQIERGVNSEATGAFLAELVKRAAR